MERESIGIKSVDSMLQGGLPNNSIIGLSGPPGIGKSIFALHYLLEGARKGQKSVYINLEEPRRNIDNRIKQFSFSGEFLEFVKSGKIVIKCLTYLEYEKIYSELFEKIREDENIKRLVIDSFNCFFTFLINPKSLATEINVRKMINRAFSFLREKGITTLLVLEKGKFCFNLPYLVDGLINLDFLEPGIIERRIFISKMRWTDQYKKNKSYKIGKEGITILEMF